MIFDASDNPATDPWATPKMPPHPTDFGRQRQTLAILWHLPRFAAPDHGWTFLPTPSDGRFRTRDYNGLHTKGLGGLAVNSLPEPSS